MLSFYSSPLKETVFYNLDAGAMQRLYRMLATAISTAVGFVAGDYRWELAATACRDIPFMRFLFLREDMHMANVNAHYLGFAEV